MKIIQENGKGEISTLKKECDKNEAKKFIESFASDNYIVDSPIENYDECNEHFITDAKPIVEYKKKKGNSKIKILED